MNAPLIARLALVLVLGGIGTVACGSSQDAEDTGTGAQALAGNIAPSKLLDDANIEGDQDVSVAQVQAFLVNKGSALAGFTSGGRSAASAIVVESRAEHISPVYLLARIETESGLVSSGTLSHISSATGCGCPDGFACDPDNAGFGMQVRCAAQTMRGYFKSLASSGSTISGWRVGVGRSTLDPCWVVPANKATAALYTYTPWVGAYAVGCGTSQWGGSSLVAALYKTFRPAFGAVAATDCDLGDGFYCGGNGVKGDAGTLYKCTNGTPAVSEKCASACERMPAGTDDKCGAAAPPPPAACSFGDGLYCGGNGTPGDPTKLYRCSGGASSVVRTCALGCERMPEGEADACAAGTACPAGDGAYCGGNLIGGSPSTLYACAAGKITKKTDCANGCSAMPAGQDDACK